MEWSHSKHSSGTASTFGHTLKLAQPTLNALSLARPITNHILVYHFGLLFSYLHILPLRSLCLPAYYTPAGRLVAHSVSKQ
jgi:hypothetical protein